MTEHYEQQQMIPHTMPASLDRIQQYRKLAVGRKMAVRRLCG
jgi:hypothetical protein